MTRWSIEMSCHLFLGLVLLAAPAVQSQEGFPAWVGLYDPAHLGWLENENRLSELCADASTFADCYSEHLAPSISVYPLYAEPESSARQIGDLIVAATPGRGLSAHFRAAGSHESIPLTPDSFLQDWGYGPYFHQSVSVQQGSWFQLPRGPWDSDVWIERESENERSSLIVIQAGDLIEMNGSGWYVLAAEQDALVLRPEQPADI